MLAMELVNTGETAQSPGIALRVHAYHNHLLPAMRSSLLAESFKLLKDHCKRFITGNINIMTHEGQKRTGRSAVSLQRCIQNIIRQIRRMEEQIRSGEIQSQANCDDLPKQYVNRKISQLSDLQLRYTYSNASSTSEFSLYQTASEAFESKFVKDDQLYTSLLDKIAEVRSIICIDNEDVLLYILHYYHWNDQKVANEYFNQNWDNLRENLQRYNEIRDGLIGKNGLCQVCLDFTELYSTGFCEHYYCRSCWGMHIKEQLMNGHTFFGCMNTPACQKAPILQQFSDRIAPELRQLNRRKICINYAIQNKDVCYCPNEKCPYFCVKPNMMQISTVTCPCGQLYCYRCQKQPHFPVLCEDVKRWYKLLNSEETNTYWIKNNTRECPKCKQPIEKKVGCSHMKCICQSEFCYECDSLWDEAHSKAKSECPKKKAIKSQKLMEDRISQLNSYLIQLMKEMQKNKALLMQCECLIQDDTLLGRVVQLKTEVISAWMTIKWTKIILCLNNKGEIQNYIQKQCMQSINSVMEPVEIIVKSYKNLVSKELHYYGQQVLQRKQILKKNVRTLLDAWEEISK